MKRSKLKKWTLMKFIAFTLIITVTITSNNNFVYALGFIMNQTEEQIIQEKETTIGNTSEGKKEIAKIIGEDISERKLNQKTFILEDGNRMVTLYPSNVHYEKEGQLLDINNTLIEENEKIENVEGSYRINYSKELGENTEIATLGKDEFNIKWKMVDNTKEEIFNENQLQPFSIQSESIAENDIVEAKITNAEENSTNISNEEKTTLEQITSEVKYEDILNETDLKYVNTPDAVKESIIIKNKEAVQNKYTFEYEAGNMIMQLNENKEILVLNAENNETIFKIEAPYMYDNNIEQSNNIEVTLTKQDNKYIVEIIPDIEWLNAPERAYPVTIDPTINTSLNHKAIKDTFIFKGDSRTPDRHKAHIIRIGSNNRLKNPPRGLIKFDLPELRSGDQVVAAMLDICNYPDTEEWTPSTKEMQINVHKMTSDWKEETASWDNCNNNYDKHITDYIKYKYDENSPFKFNYFDITAIVKDWYINGKNYGVMLKDNKETYNYNQSDAYFVSANTHSAYEKGRPMIQIVYRNQTGLEDYMSYHAQDVGRAGTVSTNNYNGNLVLSHFDVSTPGNLLNINLSHVYNTNNKDINSEFGKGFNVNYKQEISLVKINNVEYARHIDEDGTEHYFNKKENNIYLNEDNLDLRLVLNNNIFTLTDSSGNMYRFKKIGNRWLLYECETPDNQKIKINLDGNGLIKSITDAANATISFEYSGGKLSAIKDLDGQKISYKYNNNRLTQITYPDGKSSYYEYDSKNLLTRVKNIDGYNFKYDYYKEKVNRVKKITEYSTKNTEGNSVTITYDNNTTKFKDNDGYSNVYTFNDSGQTISIADFGKEENNVNNAYGKMYEYGTSGASNNKLLLESNLISIKDTPGNLIKNPYFDDGLNSWKKAAKNDSNDTVTTLDGNKVYKSTGTAYDQRKLFQKVNVSGKKGDVYNISYWVKSGGLQESGTSGKSVRVTIGFVKNDNSMQWIDSFVNTDSPNWQFMSKEIIANSDYKAIDIYLMNNYNANETYWDNIGLFKDEKGNSYLYDSNGNVVSTVDQAKQNSKFNYSSNGKIATSVNPKGGKFTYEYDSSDKNRLVKASNNMGQEYKFTYDNNGNVTESKVEATDSVTMPENGKSYNIVFAQTNKILDIKNESKDNGANVHQWKHEEGYKNKEFKFNQTEDGYFNISANHSNKNIDLDINSGNIQQWSTRTSGNQKWKAIDNGDGTIRLVNKEKGDDYCISLEKDSSEDGTNIIIDKWEGKGTQKLKLYDVNGSNPFVNIDKIESEEVYRIKAKHSNLYLEVAGDANKNSIEIKQQEYKANDKKQLWRIIRVEDGTYKIVNLASNEGKTIDVKGGDNINENPIQIYESNETTAQKWEIIKNNDNTFTFKTKLAGEERVIDIHGKSKEPNGKAYIYNKVNGENQKFYLEKADYVDIDADSTYRIKIKHSNKYVGVNETTNNVEQQDSNDTNKQKWKLKRLNNGYYKLVSVDKPDCVLDVDRAQTVKETNIKIYTESATENKAQQFEFVPVGDGSFSIRPRLTNGKLCLDVADGSKENKANIWLWTINNTGAQQFYLEEIIQSESKQYVSTTGEYSEDGRYLTKMTDELGNEAKYEYDVNRGLVTKEIDPNNNETIYTYDSNTDDVLSISKNVGGKEYSNTYTYEDDKIKTINHNDTVYSYNYDEFGNVKDIMVGDKILKTTNYSSDNGSITEILYANNQNVKYQYDRFNRVIKKEKSTGDIELTYDSKSNIKTVKDNGIGITKNYTYDLANRLTKAEYSNGFSSMYEYDDSNNLHKIEYKLDSYENSETFNYDSDNNINSISFNNSIIQSNYDELARKINQEIINEKGRYIINYNYKDMNQSNKTTILMQSIKNGNSEAINYTYDNLGNIETISEGENLITKYYYDELNQIIREDNKKQEKTITYEYDKGGNLLSKKEYPYTETDITVMPTTIIEYLYNNANWKDQLTSFNGKEITYDEIGNIIQYEGNIYTWQNGKELATIKNERSGLNISYKYNDDGVRTEKTLNGVTTQYYLDGDIVVFEKTGDDVIYYQYDDGQNLIGFIYNNEQYYYIKNVQNDIIGILNNNLEQIVSYNYDSWGKLISIKDQQGNDITNDVNHIGYKNPYRYRSYRYDTETGLYYLQNRYYNPEWGRFISTDVLLSTGTGILEHNMYAYCDNNPVMNIDTTGNLSISIGTIIAFIVATAVVCITAPTIRDTFSNINLPAVSSSTKTKSKTTTTTKTKRKSKRNKSDKDNYIYVLRDKKTKKIEYVGRTVNVSATKIRHQMNEDRENLELKVIEKNLNWYEARVKEQYYIMKFRTLNRGVGKNNQINGLRRQFWNKPEFAQYLPISLETLLPESETYVGE